jgi:hypothetical protein
MDKVATERHADLMKQGFMRPRQQRIVTIYRAWTPDGVTYTGENKWVAQSHVAQYGGEVIATKEAM